MQDEETDAFFLQLTALARQYGSVSVYSEESCSQTASSKEVLTYTTTNENDAADWAKAKTKEGYEVTISYNSKTGVFTCIAVK